MYLREVIEQSLLTHILPIPVKGDDEAQWVDRLLSVMRRLNEQSKQTMLFVAGFNPYVLTILPSELSISRH